ASFAAGRSFVPSIREQTPRARVGKKLCKAQERRLNLTAPKQAPNASGQSASPEVPPRPDMKQPRTKRPLADSTRQAAQNFCWERLPAGPFGDVSTGHAKNWREPSM